MYAQRVFNILKAYGIENSNEVLELFAICTSALIECARLKSDSKHAIIIRWNAWWIAGGETYI